MNKRIVILLIAALTVGSVFAGQAEVKLAVKQSSTSINVVVPLPISNSLHSGASDSNPFPTVPDMIIASPMADWLQQPYWMRSAQYQRQIHGFARTRHGTYLIASGGGKLVLRGGQSRLTSPELLSGSLSLLSPPGLILRL